MKLSRLRDVTKVLGALAGGEAARAVGLGANKREPEAPDRQQQRARAVRHALEQLGPLYVKVGQMLSTRPDLCPST